MALEIPHRTTLAMLPALQFHGTRRSRTISIDLQEIQVGKHGDPFNASFRRAWDVIADFFCGTKVAEGKKYLRIFLDPNLPGPVRARAYLQLEQIVSKAYRGHFMRDKAESPGLWNYRITSSPEIVAALGVPPTPDETLREAPA